MNEHDNPKRLSEHEERFHDLCALAPSGNLSSEEAAELDEHLKTCADCREAYQEYASLATEGMPSLAAEYATRQSNTNSVGDEMVEATRRRLLDCLPVPNGAAIQEDGAVRHAVRIRPGVPTPNLRRVLQLATAACLVFAMSAGTYQLGRRRAVVPTVPKQAADPQVAKLASEKIVAETLVSAQTTELDRLREDSQQKEKELGKLQVQLKAAGNALSQAAEDKGASDVRLQQQRDAFAEQIHQKEQAYDQIQTELTHLNSERAKTLLQLTSLEREVETLSAEKQDQLKRVKDQEVYLAADRDIRELMGARQLYIADVFDVSSDSRTRKPYGRVFYTKGKSLIFYAFDLDGQSGIKNASTFQAWGKNESALDRPVNLGVLYLDNEANRRWVLRCDNPEQLTAIDAVFVTVEPNARGNKPTTKPFLYASLRKEPNHP
jgi:hypothetical protein